jgi:hypothetical protein
MATMRKIIRVPILTVLAFLLLVGRPASVDAFDPPYPSGIPWPTTVPWPTANPLKIGVPWAPYVQINPIPAPTPLPPVVLHSNNPAPTPLPPVVLHPNNPAPTSIPSPISSAPIPIAPSPNESASTPVPPPTNTPVQPVVSAVAANTGSGDTQSDALVPNDTWQNLDAGGSVWYRIGSGGVHMDVWLDSNPVGGMSMSVFAPNGSNQPIGRGTGSNSSPGRLLWSGGNWRANGDWYALVTNGNPFPVQYKIGRSQFEIVKHECHSYWESIGGSPVFWTICD